MSGRKTPVLPHTTGFPWVALSPVVRLVAQPVCFLLISRICQSKAQYYPLCPDFQLGKLGELNFRNFFPECEFTLILRILVPFTWECCQICLLEKLRILRKSENIGFQVCRHDSSPLLSLNLGTSTNFCSLSFLVYKSWMVIELFPWFWKEWMDNSCKDVSIYPECGEHSNNTVTLYINH